VAVLSGLRVLDLTNVLSGPFCTLHLALLGAEVVKIENPKDGDLARKLGNVPKLNKQLMGTSFLAQNANKKSITLNLKARGEVFKAGSRRRDRENFRPGDGLSPCPGLGEEIQLVSARSRASARPAPMRSSPPTTRSSRA
jgi:crotonobetainyl-CoA:carnitine CoA-transferase CaiB-like acyl-CoA transferase